MKEIAKNFDHQSIEEKMYSDWENAGYFKPEFGRCFKYNREKNGKPFVISMPPPNVTGKLHVGHSVVVAIEDIMVRFHRLKGEPTLWLPGTDHGGIATQTVVDKDLRKQGINKNEIGREDFVKRVWDWKEKYGSIIVDQTRRLGASCDWSRERFTLDPGMSEAVKEAFVVLYNKGLIYRGEYIVNWCPKCHTAIADDEVEHIEQESKLYYFKYDKNFPITIATTRPETKLGDVAVAVNPNDKRYKELIGKSFDIDLDGTKRKIEIVSDRAVDEKFGTGAVGVTPAHSITDCKMAEEHKLVVLKVIDENGRMTDEVGEKYQGLKTLEAREKLIGHLRQSGLLEKEDEYLNNLSICYRCGGAIEPLPSLQWFVKMKPLAEKARKAVENGEIKIIPERFEKVYFHWLDNIRDWCISRQLWWGHQIPVWYRGEEIYVGKIDPVGDGWKQDPNVLDTWFSSALWPFSTLGWPKETKDYKYFYPTTVMETGYDILFFWVARMIMFGLEFTGKSPFETVYLHGLVRDEKNRKMSKSLGNVMDPLDIIQKYGTDALRMALVVGAAPGQDTPVGEGKIKGYRNFSNKIWNASRFTTLRVSEGNLQTGETGNTKLDDLEIDQSILTEADKNILSAHAETIKEVTKLLYEFKFSYAGEKLYEFFWHSFADVYIEEAKNHFENSAPESGISNPESRTSQNTKKILVKVLSETLTMLHPFMPFVTEAVWQELRGIYPKLSESIMISTWPK